MQKTFWFMFTIIEQYRGGLSCFESWSNHHFIFYRMKNSLKLVNYFVRWFQQSLMYDRDLIEKTFSFDLLIRMYFNLYRRIFYLIILEIFYNVVFVSFSKEYFMNNIYYLIRKWTTSYCHWCLCLSNRTT